MPQKKSKERKSKKTLHVDLPTGAFLNFKSETAKRNFSMQAAMEFMIKRLQSSDKRMVSLLNSLKATRKKGKSKKDKKVNENLDILLKLFNEGKIDLTENEIRHLVKNLL